MELWATTKTGGRAAVEQAIAEEMERLANMPLPQLRARYREVYGEEANSGHRQHLVRRIAWRLQVLAQGDLTERAQQRAREIARDADLKTQVPRGGAAGAVVGASGERRDRRLPVVGSVLRGVA